MTKRATRFHWPFYVCCAWATISCVYALAQWLINAPEPDQWLVYAALLPFLLCWWYQGILEIRDKVDRETRTIRAEVRAEAARAMKGKISKRRSVIDTELKKQGE